MQYSSEDFQQLEPRYRAQLINSLSGFKSANLIGTQDSEGQLNLAIVSSVVHLGATPPLIAMIVRPNTVPRHSFDNLQHTGYFTINQVGYEFYQQAHQTSARYDKAESEFDKVGLTPEHLSDIPAPFVAESKLKYAVKVREINHLAINNTEMVIGEIVQLTLDDQAIRTDGYVDIEALQTVAVSGLDSYHQTQRLARLSYAKAELPLQVLDL